MAADFSVPQRRMSRERKASIPNTRKETSRKSFSKINLQMTERFRMWLRAQKYAPSTQERYHRVAKELCEHIGAKSLSSVTPMDIGDFLTHTLPDRWADNYVADRLGCLRCFFDFLYLGGVVDSVAPRFLKSRTRKISLPRILTKSEIKKMLHLATHPRDRALVELLYSTGCRIGEIRLLRVEAIDFRARKFKVGAKRKDRVV
jgi:integrase/recombinase XerD